MSDSPQTAVVGGGITGLVTALLFARSNHPVALIEPQLERTLPSGAIEVRTFAITPSTRRLLDVVGAWKRLDHSRIGEIDHMAVWDATSTGRIAFRRDVLRSGPMGWIVEQANLRAALQQVVDGTPRIRCIEQRLQGLQAEQDGAGRILLGDGRELVCALIVAADGMDSQTRRLAGIGWQQSPYGQQAFIANVTTDKPHGRAALQRFLPTGPLAFLPLVAPNASSIVWSCDDTLATSIARADDAAFMAALGDAFEGRLGTVRSTTARKVFPLTRARAECFARGRVVLVGDAAHVIHPLAGQGLNLGLLDAAALVECCGEQRAPAWPRSRDLRRYARWRASELADLATVTHGLRHLFSLDGRAASRLRGLGMRATERLAPLNRWLCERAMGNVGDLPRLAQPSQFEENPTQ